jgi:WD40 repeat protein
VLQRLVDWLSGPDTDYRARAVTGDPGSGKSAVLGRLVTLADPKARELAVRHEVEPSTVPPVGSIDVAIYARNHATADVLAALADGLKIQAITVPELLEAVGTKPRHRVVVIDGVDEAADPRDLVTGLIRPLLEHAPRASLRLLLGIRRPLVDALGPHTVVLDLDDPSYFKQDDVADYVAKILLRTEARPPSPGERPQQPPGRGRTALTSPYTGRPELARTVARAIAERAGRNFLVARLVARDHLYDQPIPEPHAFAWRQRLPETVREAFEHYLEQFGDNRQKARDLLTPLAWAEGAGLPWEHLWAPIARSLAEQGTYTDDDVSWLLTAAAAYLVEGREVYPRDSGTEGRSVYRLYHQALADHLRDESKTADVQSRIVDALVASVPREPAGAIDWFGAHPYILSYLPVHAAAAGRLDEFMSDPRFLLSVDADRLLEILPRLTKPSAIAAHMVYQQCVHQLRAGPTGLASAYLMMMARQSGIHALADEVARLASAAPWSMAWTTPWAHWYRSRPYRLARRQVNPPPVVALSFFGSPQAIVSADEAGTVQLWDVQLATEVGQGIRTQWRGVTALAVVTLADGPAVITGGAEGTLHLWNPLTGEELGDAVHAHNGKVLAMAVEAYDHSPVLVSGGEDGTVRVWKLPDCRPIGSPLTPRQPVSRRPRPSAVTALATSVLGGDLVAVAGMADGSLHFWDVGLGRQLGEVSEAHIPRVRALATATVGNQTLLLSGGDDGVVRIWDLRQRRPVGEPLAGHRRGVHAVAACLVQGRLLIVSGGWDGAIKVWDERDRRPVGNPLAAHRGQVRTAVVGEHEKVPVIVSGGQDGTIRFCEWTREDVVSDRMPGSDRRMRALTAAYRGDRPVVVAGGAGGTLRMYDWADGTQVIAPMIGHSLAVTSVVTFLVDRRRTIVSASWDESVRFWDMSSGGFINACYSAHSSGVRCLATAQLRTRPVVVSGGADGKLRAWDPGAAVPLGAGFVVHRGEVTAVAVTRIGREPFVVSAGSDQCVWMTRLTDRMILGELRGHNSVVCALEVDSEAGGMVVGGTEDGVVLMWDPKRPHSAARLVHRHQDRVSALTTCTYDGQTVVASGSSDCTVLVRMLASGQTQTVEVGLPVRALRLMPGGVGLVIGCDSGLLALRFRSFDEQPGSMGGGAGGG